MRHNKIKKPSAPAACDSLVAAHASQAQEHADARCSSRDDLFTGSHQAQTSSHSTLSSAVRGQQQPTPGAAAAVVALPLQQSSSTTSTSATAQCCSTLHVVIGIGIRNAKLDLLRQLFCPSCALESAGSGDPLPAKSRREARDDGSAGLGDTCSSRP